MHKTFGNALNDAYLHYENKDYHNAIMESAKLIEKHIGYVINNFFPTLETYEHKTNFLSFEKKNDQKMADMRNKPMLGFAIGLYRALGESFPEHEWLRGNRVTEKMNALNEIRKKIAHPAASALDIEESAFIAFDSAKYIISQANFEQIRLERLYFPLYTYLVYSTIKARFKDADSRMYGIIANTSQRIYPCLLDALWCKTYPSLPQERKTVCLEIYDRLFGDSTELHPVSVYEQFYREGDLYRFLENGNDLGDALAGVCNTAVGNVTKIHARRHIHILDILFRNFAIVMGESYFKLANQVMNLYFVGSSIGERDRERLYWSAKTLLLSDSDADKVAEDVVAAIQDNILYFEVLASGEQELQVPVHGETHAKTIPMISGREIDIGDFRIHFTYDGNESRREQAKGCLTHYFILHKLIFRNDFDTEMLCSIGSFEYVMASLKAGTIYIHDHGNYREQLKHFGEWCDLLRAYRKAKMLRYRDAMEFAQLPFKTWDYAVNAIKSLSEAVVNYYQQNDTENPSLAKEIQIGANNVYEAEALLHSLKDEIAINAGSLGQLALRLEFSITAFHKIILENPLSKYLPKGTSR